MAYNMFNLNEADLDGLPGGSIVIDKDGDVYDYNYNSATGWGQIGTEEECGSRHIVRYAPVRLVWTPGDSHLSVDDDLLSDMTAIISEYGYTEVQAAFRKVAATWTR